MLLWNLPFADSRFVPAWREGLGSEGLDSILLSFVFFLCRFQRSVAVAKDHFLVERFLGQGF